MKNIHEVDLLARIELDLMTMLSRFINTPADPELIKEMIYGKIRDILDAGEMSQYADSIDFEVSLDVMEQRMTVLPNNFFTALAMQGVLYDGALHKSNIHEVDGLIYTWSDGVLKIKTAMSKVGDSMLVAAFPGTGKSYYCSNGNWSQSSGFCTDSDSSKFDKSEFPANYIEHIKKKIAEGYKRIFISSHKDVRNALVDNQLPFVLIYPSKDLKDEYIQRYIERGNDENFVRLVSENWDVWLDECRAQTGCFHIELASGQYVSDVV